MTKPIIIHGHGFKLYDLDKSYACSSSPPSIVAYGRRIELLILGLQKRFERVDKLQEPVPDTFN